MGLREALAAGLARQLGHPSGLRGRVVGAMLNRGNAAAVRGAVEAVGLRAGESAADIGFGGGFGLSLLLGGPCREVHGVDISATMLSRALRRYRSDVGAGRLWLRAGSLTSLPLPDNSIDAAITVNTVYFVDDMPKAAHELARVLAPGGRAVIGIGDPTAMAAMPMTRHGFRIRPIAELEDAVVQAGLAVTSHTRVGDGDGAFHLLLIGWRAACSR